MNTVSEKTGTHFLTQAGTLVADTGKVYVTVDVKEQAVRQCRDALEKDLAFWKQEAIDATHLLRAAVKQFPNDDGWLDQAKSFMTKDRDAHSGT